MADSLREFVADELWLAVAVLTLPVTALVMLAGLESVAMAITILGWFALTPTLLFWGDELAAYLFADAEAESGTNERQATAPDPLAELKSRYASGEIDEREFERRVERLVALDDVDVSDADLDVLLDDESSNSVDRETAPQRELERER